MFVNTQKSFTPIKWLISRCLSTAEAATVLRPFYFAVHPDLFGKHPKERSVNENSLKQLSSFLAALQTASKITRSARLPFYIRNTSDRDKFMLVYISLSAQESRYSIVKSILKACRLPTDQLEKYKKTDSPRKREPSFKYHGSRKTKSDFEDGIFGDIIFATQKAREAESLKTWLYKNADVAQKRLIALRELKGEVYKLQNDLLEKLQLLEMRWECGWNIEHYRGCLKSLQGLYTLHPETMKILEGRILVFAPFTGVSLDGHVMLNSGEVQNNWLDLIKNVRTHEKTLRNIPAHEHALSKVLRDIKVGRRKFMPKILASEYASHLRKITTSLLDYLSKRQYPSQWPQSLAEYEIVVECEAGPLMVTPTGQMITPSSYPGTLLVDFITENLEVAKRNMIEYERNKHKEKYLQDVCMSAFSLESLTKDDSIVPENMIDCLERLLKINVSVIDTNLLAGSALHVTNYYSVLSDGTICVPWNWKL